MIAALSLAVAAWRGGDDTHKVVLTGSAERPNKVNTAATGTAEFRWSDDNKDISYTVSVKGLSSLPTGVHIHGPADSNGTAPVLATLDLVDTSMTGTIAKGTIGGSVFEKITREALKELFDWGRAYVNVHTKNYPDGEIRGHFKK
jgi:hypothetical protein